MRLDEVVFQLAAVLINEKLLIVEIGKFDSSSFLLEQVAISAL